MATDNGSPGMDDGQRAAAWSALEDHAQTLADVRITDLFEADPDRFGHMSARASGILVDFSKTVLTAQTLDSLLALARACNLESRRTAMFAGERINMTEGRAVLHTALRRMDGAPLTVDGRDVVADVETVVDKMGAFVERVHSGRWVGHTGERITDIVNIGIGGSDLGPRFVVDALRPHHKGGLRCHFVSNVDGVDLAECVRELDPATTLFVVASKSFTTQETMANARSARAWLLAALGSEEAVAKHFVAVSTNLEAVAAFGIDPANAFAFWDWVGGRYSLWSAIGLPILLAVGLEGFNALRRGAFEMDRHFQETPLERNLPVLLGLVGLWHTSFRHHPTLAVLPYCQRLKLLPAYLQQADMESNGKRVTRAGEGVGCETAPVLWGGIGTDVQHSFFQMLHQGTQIVPGEFIAVARPEGGTDGHHRLLMANFFAQTEALARGQSGAEAEALLQSRALDPDEIESLTPHTTFTGNRPSVSLLVDSLTPERLGALIALYEHKIFVQGTIWDINSYDQFGVELGKRLAKRLLDQDGPAGMTGSTQGLIEAYEGLCRDGDRLKTAS
ncbi:MAG: glucose-6-phosphate isomerase [Alphaproteobacteria bacterium]